MSRNNNVKRTDHDDEDDLLITRKPFFELEKNAKEEDEWLRVFLIGLFQNDMIARINQLELPDKSLNFLSGGLL